MSKSKQQSSLPPAVLETLLEMVRREIPEGEAVTFDSSETAVIQLLRKLGPDLLAATLQQEIEKSTTPSEGVKRGHRRSVPADK